MYSSTLPSTTALDGGGWSTPRPGRFTSGKDPVPTVKEAGWAPGPVWTGAENLASTEIRSPDRPVPLKIQVSWDVTLHHWTGSYRRFEATWSLNFRGSSFETSGITDPKSQSHIQGDAHRETCSFHQCLYEHLPFLTRSASVVSDTRSSCCGDDSLTHAMRFREAWCWPPAVLLDVAIVWARQCCKKKCTDPSAQLDSYVS